MATDPKTSGMPKDTQVKPIGLGNEPENSQTEDPLQNSKLYNAESVGLLQSKTPNGQANVQPSKVAKSIIEADQDSKETDRGENTNEKAESETLD